MSLPSVSVVVPVHDAAATVPELVARLRTVLPGCAKDWEVILVNDGSRDASWNVLQGLCARHGELQAIDLAGNPGQHAALLCGVRAARGEWIVTLDDDLQHPPEAIPALLQAGLAGADLVYGSAPNPDQGLPRRLASRAVRALLVQRTGTPAAALASSLRCFRAPAREVLAHGEHGARLFDLLLLSPDVRATSVAVLLEPRRQGSSGYELRRLVLLSLGVFARRKRGEVVPPAYVVREVLRGGS